MTPVEEIKERLSIVDVVQEYIPLKKAGVNHKGNCPFHNEKTPSFTVSESKQFFHCFGCGKGGDIFTFVQEMEAVEFPEALRMLAAKANVELKAQNPQEQNERTRLLDCLTKATELFQRNLQNEEVGKIARAYLEERGIHTTTAANFQLGYSADSWDTLVTALKKEGFSENEIEKAGLAIRSPKNGSVYDRFRGRVMFPIHNAHGNVVGFTARTLNPNEKEAKCINTPQTAVYNKSAALYGIHLAKKFIQKMNAAVIVEGNVDVVSAHQAKFRNVVAASGTALTEEQVRLLKRYSPNVLFAFDADGAGLKAVWRGMQIAITEGMNIKIMRLPTGQDPDDIIRKNPQQFRELAIAAKPFMDYAFDTVLTPLDLGQVHHKKLAAAELLPMIALLPDSIEQTHYVKLLADQLDVASEILQEKLRTAPKAQQPKSASIQTTAEKPVEIAPISAELSQLDVLGERLLAVLTLYTEGFDEIEAEEGFLVNDEELGELYKLLESSYNQHGILDIDLVHFPHPSFQHRFESLCVIGDDLYGHLDSDEMRHEFETLLKSMELYRTKHRLHELQRELSAAEKRNDGEAIQTLSEEFSQLTERLRKLS